MQLQPNKTRTPHRRDGITRDGEGALEEPWVSVRRAHSPQRNPRTGTGYAGLPYPAPENQDTAISRPNARPTAPEADDPPPPLALRGEGSRSMARPEEEAADWLNTLLLDEEQEQEQLEDPDWELDEITYESEDEYSQELNVNNTTQYNPTPASQQHIKNLRGPKLGKTIGSINVRGRTMTYNGKRTETEKFKRINQLMRRNAISILALLDTHWDDEKLTQLREQHPKLGFHATHGENNRIGICFVVDKNEEEPSATSFTEIEKGCSGHLTVEYAKQNISMIALYAPNENEAKTKSIRNIRNYLQNSPHKGRTLVLGDFNMVESARDRNPQHSDDITVTRELTRLKIQQKMSDGWRLTNGEDINFTWRGYSQGNYTLSRIDRIYIPDEMLHNTNEWNIVDMEPGVTDHSAITVKLLEPEAPFIGKGEWRMNLQVLNEETFRIKSGEKLQELERKIKNYIQKVGKKGNNRTLERTINIRNASGNPQRVWQEYKLEIKKEATAAHKRITERRTIERRIIEKRISKLKKNMSAEVTEEGQKHLRLSLETETTMLNETIERQRQTGESAIAARWFKENESGSKMWFSLRKERPKRQILHSLFQNNGDETKSTAEMLDIAHTHHETLQSRQPMTAARQENITQSLSKIHRRINENSQQILTAPTKRDEVRKIIKKMPCGKTPGCDGIPSEFWKWESENAKKDEKRIDIQKLMTIVFQDIDKWGPINHNFAEARMSLLYKKKDKRRIENYRPITLLNTDYKIYTSILTARLSKPAIDIIHPDQAGFMSGRRIYNQTKLTELLIKHCENRSQNGFVIALDQEKAYDRIDHEYLWQTMSAFELPDTFINKVKNLYKHAKTSIRLNGCTSETFNVHRGVRQGDPLSCLLYNIAIEPLFENIRMSTIEGLKIDDGIDNIKVQAYADDTEAFLAETDSFDELEHILNLFCNASTASFNIEKTEIIPVGTEEFRRQAIASRMICGRQLDQRIKIASDEQPVRILGSYQGNNVNADAKWRDIIDSQNRIMKLWGTIHPSASGRVRILKALVMSRALYLMTVNGIPKRIAEEMERNIRSFLWQGKKGSISWERAIQSKKDGGLGAPSVHILHEATKIMWVKQWLAPKPHRPKWAQIANCIIEDSIRNEKDLPKGTCTEWIEQTWREKIRSTKIPNSLREMIMTAKKHNIQWATKLVGCLPFLSCLAFSEVQVAGGIY